MLKDKVVINVDGDEKGGDEITLVSPELKDKINEVSIITPNESDKPEIQKKVKIKMREDHKCYIGGEWYHLLKEKQYNVPENVKDILASRDLLLPL